MDWFSVSKQGLAKILERRGKDFVPLELISNALDEDVTEVIVSVEPIPGEPKVKVQIEDDSPEGFRQLSDAWTLFAPSYKVTNATVRGRYNLGEKLVLACCDWAEVLTTSGTVTFDKRGRHHNPRRKRPKGSLFSAFVRMTREELAHALSIVRTMLPPHAKRLVVNKEEIPFRQPVRAFDAVLQTEVADEEGNLRRRDRKTAVEIYDVQSGGVPYLYELGIPVVELEGGERWSVSVAQRVPLNVDRDNVTPSYLRDLRAHVLNQMKNHLTEEDASAPWVKDAIEDDAAEPEAVDKVRMLEFGEKSVIQNPGDPEANCRAVAAGYTLIPPATFSRTAWSKIKAHGKARVSSEVTPAKAAAFSPDGRPMKYLDSENWTEGMRRVVHWMVRVGSALLERALLIQVAVEVTFPPSAFYQTGKVTLNLGRLSKKWFEGEDWRPWLELLVHELSHDRVSNHLSDEFADEIARLGAKSAWLARTSPQLFELEK